MSSQSFWHHFVGLHKREMFRGWYGACVEYSSYVNSVMHYGKLTLDLPSRIWSHFRFECDGRCSSCVYCLLNPKFTSHSQESHLQWKKEKKKKSVNVPLSSSARASPLSTLYTTLVFGSTFDGNVSAAALIQVCNDPIAVRAVTPPINQTCPVCAFVYVSVRARVD